MRLAALLVILATATLSAQQPLGDVAFEAASIKPFVPDGQGLEVEARPGRFIANNAAVIHLMEFAFGLRADQILGGDDWVRTERFDVEAVTPPGVPPEDVPLLVRRLLRDRFRLATRDDLRELPIHILLTSRDDGRLGPALVPASTDCGEILAQRRANGPSRPTSFGARPVCGLWQFAMFHPGKGVVITVKGDAATIGDLTERLAGVLRRSIVDRTGLTGRFDLDLQFVPDPRDGAVPEAAASELGVSIFTAVQEQLGLRLQPDRGQVPVLLIDQVARPSEN